MPSVQYQPAIADFAKQRDNIHSLLDVQHDRIVKLLEEVDATQKEIHDKHNATQKSLEETKQQLQEKEAALQSVTEDGKKEKEALLTQISELTDRVKHTQQEKAVAIAEVEHQRTVLKQHQEKVQAAKTESEKHHKELVGKLHEKDMALKASEDKIKEMKAAADSDETSDHQREDKLTETQNKLRDAESRHLPTTPGHPMWISCINWGGKNITSKAVYEKCRKAALNHTAVTFDNEFFGEDPWHFHKKTGFVAYQYNGRGPIRYLVQKEHESAKFDKIENVK